MQSIPVVRDGQGSDLETLVELFSDSFSEDPVLNWIIPLPDIYPKFFRVIIEDIFLPKGIVHIEEQGRSGAMWLRPGAAFDIPPRMAMIRLILTLAVRKGIRPLLRIYRQGAVFERHQPIKPHYHLVFIGSRRANQGHGFGSAVLKQGTRLCDEEGMPAYLESSNPLNVPLYQRHGFEIMAEEVLPGDGPKVWFMWREPRQP